MSSILNNSQNPKIVETVQAILFKIMPHMRRLEEQQGVSSKPGSRGHKRSLSTGGTPHASALAELGFSGLLNAGNFAASKAKKNRLAGFASLLIDVLQT